MVDRVALEMRSTRKCTGGSNPSLSAILKQYRDRPLGSIVLQGFTGLENLTSFNFNRNYAFEPEVRKPMFRSKTVFILGAGASAEVGLPIGNELKKIIAQKIDIRFDYGQTQVSGDGQIMQALWEHTMFPDRRRGDPNPYLHAAWKLRDALPQAISIDNLLDAYRADEPSETIGKLGIVRSILEAELASKIYYKPNQSERINFGTLDETWFAGFVKILTENVPRSDVEKIFDNVGILNFNYDRCIEHYLHESLENYYSLEANAVTDLIDRIQILHPYGSVGSLPW